MNIWNKVLVGLNIVVAAAFFYFAVTVLRARNYWGENMKAYENALSVVAKEKAELIDGTSDGKPGIRQLHAEVDQLLPAGRVWRNSEPQAVKAAVQPEVSVVTQLAAPHRESVQAHLYLFEESGGQGAGAYMGEFAVKAIGGRQWQLEAVRPMTKAELARLEASQKKRTPWSLYEVFPTLDDKAGVDYQVLFNDFYRQRAELNDLIAATNNDLHATELAEVSAKQYVELLRKDIASLGGELKSALAQDKIVADHRTALEHTLGELKDAVQKADQANRIGASEVARLQLEAIRQIDQRTNKIAQTARAK